MFCDLNLMCYWPSRFLEEANYVNYSMREGRCEGSHVKPVNHESLALRSFIESFRPFDPSRDHHLVLEWNAPKDGKRDVQLRAFSLRSGDFRMDTVKPSSQGSYSWPSEILAFLRLGDRDLGVLAWIICLGQETGLEKSISLLGLGVRKSRMLMK